MYATSAGIFLICSFVVIDGVYFGSISLRRLCNRVISCSGTQGVTTTFLPPVFKREKCSEIFMMRYAIKKRLQKYDRGPYNHPWMLIDMLDT